jgi:glucose-6-phosphate isomerase
MAHRLFDTVPVWWGGAGTDTQHSFQALHQRYAGGAGRFDGVLQADHAHAENHQALLLEDLLARDRRRWPMARTAMTHIVAIRIRPKRTLFILDALTPGRWGCWSRWHEHSVYMQSVLWDINAFDQFDVGLGKRVASRCCRR